jgi:nitrate reductase delta subunit
MTGRQKLLKLASLLLDYPDEERGRLLGECERLARSLAAGDGRDLLGRFLREIRTMPQAELAAHYSEIFDFHEENALYLTFHEAGEGSERARLLLDLKGRAREAGYEVPEDELPDYLPLLLELLAVRPKSGDDLAPRVGRCVGRLTANLARAKSPYRFLLAAAGTVLPTSGEAGGLAPPAARSAAEDDVPYPLHHAQS